MTRSLGETRNLHAAEQKVLHDIDHVGWHVVKVFASAGESGPEWAFSIGLFHSFLHPEVIIFGLPLNTCADLINEIGRQIKNGRRFDGQCAISGILTEPYTCVFRPVPMRIYAEYVGFAQWFYEADPFPVMQCFWPDKAGRFPWEAGCERATREAQPLLFASGIADP